ncbi:aldo/keto reductase [Bacillus sp. HMF5848]|uniref:aldo/keto reductase n=1 Tax=Bacillus sp. HMF5848 TaxID=2495421 RepID=UPI000F79EDFA|nr:aldo/keto reductase [Bacillus sp. HMF5848]RSK27722.1 aldo/keto reductase [Bacillus sp. HMF5848]
MEKRRIGSSDLYVSKMGLGCMSIGTDKEKARSIIDAALDHEINYVDTADLYDFGINEEIVGAAIKARRHDIIVATKAGNRWNEDKSGWTWDPSKAHIKEACKDSLRRLQTDYIDLYQLHGGTIDDPIDETIEAFEELQKEGYIRHYGISSIRPNVIREYIDHSNIVSVMMQYSILDRRPEEEILNLLHQHNISVIARGPVAKGILSNRPLCNDSFLDYTHEELNQLRTQLMATLNRDLHEVALQYDLSHPNVAAVIPGASRIKQVLENVNAVKAAPLTQDALEAIRHMSKANKYEQHR